MRTLVLCAAAVAAALALTAGPEHARGAEERTEARLAPGSTYLIPRIDRWRRETWHWQRLLGKARTPTSYADRASLDPEYRRWVLRLWQRRAVHWRKRAQDPPHLRQWLCIFRHERNPRQGWRTRTGNGFYGGLQMNRAFMRNYGRWLLRRKGTADRWRPIEQIWVAERGRRTQGWHAWPNTARACGLL